MIRNLHKEHMIISVNFVQYKSRSFGERWFVGRTFKTTDKIKSLLPPMTMSYGHYGFK